MTTAGNRWWVMLARRITDCHGQNALGLGVHGASADRVPREWGGVTLQ